MSVKISIPLSLIFFPITLPIALVRLVIAGVVAVIISPTSLYTLLRRSDNTFGYTRKYTVSETRTLKKAIAQDGKGFIPYQVQEVHLHPGLIRRIAGAKPKTEKLWSYLSYELPRPAFLEDGSHVPPQLTQMIEEARNKQKAKEQYMDWRESNLYTIRSAVDA